MALNLSKSHLALFFLYSYLATFLVILPIIPLTQKQKINAQSDASKMDSEPQYQCFLEEKHVCLKNYILQCIRIEKNIAFKKFSITTLVLVYFSS